MIMTFIGKPDHRFPDLVPGNHYGLKIQIRLHPLPGSVVVEWQDDPMDPRTRHSCPYDTVEKFLENWTQAPKDVQ